MCNKDTCPIKSENDFLRAEIDTLKKELEKYKKPPKDSSNSSMPPSQDQNRKPYPSREKSDRNSGGQKGHKGETRMLSDTSDETIEVYPLKCLHCGGLDFNYTKEVRERRQLIDLPRIEPTVTEFEQRVAICTHCGKRSHGRFPENIKAPVQIGPQTEATIGYLLTVHREGYDKIQQIFLDLFNFKLSEGTIDRKLNHLEKILEPEYNNILEKLKSSSTIGSDETGIKINGIKGYLWIFQNELYCYFKSTVSRAFQVIAETIGENFIGNWISDRFGSQLKIKAKHQLCLAHLIRDCKYNIKYENSIWSKDLKELFQEMIKFKNDKGKEYNPYEKSTFREIKSFETRMGELFSKPPPDKEAKKLYKSLVGRQEQLILFLFESEVSPTNNDSERGLRNRVIHKKVSGGFRTTRGAQRFDKISSVIETAKKQDRNPLDELLYFLRKDQYLLSI